MKPIDKIFKSKTQEEIDQALENLSMYERFMLECRMNINQFLNEANISTQADGEAHDQIINAEIHKVFFSEKQPVVLAGKYYQEALERVTKKTTENISEKAFYVYVEADSEVQVILTTAGRARDNPTTS